MDSLENGHRLPFWFINESQRFEREDTVAMAVNLLRTADKGAVGSVGPTGHTFLVEHFSFLASLLDEMVGNPGTPIGSILLNVKQVPSRRAYRIVALLADPALVIRTRATTGTDEDPPLMPTEIALMQNYPNPFNPSTTISFDIPHSSFVVLKVYDIIGREVATLVSEEMKPGSYEVTFDAAGLANGVYLYRLTAGSFSDVKKLLLLK